MKRFVYGIFMTMSLVMASCKSDNSADVRGMLQTVPADASVVMVADIQSLVEKTGGKIDGAKVIPGDEVAQSIAKTGNERLKSITGLLESGAVEPGAAVFFIEGYNSYLTGFVADTDKFKDWAKQRYGEEFSKDGESETCGNVLLNGNRFWICTSSRNTINARDIQHFISLSEKQSILFNKAASELAELRHAVSGWGDIKGVMTAAGMEFSSRAAATMAIEAVFTDAVEFLWNVDIDKKGISADLNFINSKSGIAKFNFPVAKIDEATVRSLEGSAPGVMAIAISPEMVNKLKEETGGKGFSMLGLVANMIGCVDGTCAAAFSDSDNVRGVISTTGHNTTDLSQMLQELGMRVSMDGKMMKFGKGETKGGISVSDASSQLKGAMAGVVYSGESKGMENAGSISVTLKSEKGGLTAHINLLWKE